jgi:hypothetical protein
VLSLLLRGAADNRAKRSPAKVCGAAASRLSILGDAKKWPAFSNELNGHIEVHSSLLNVVLHDQPQIKT